MCPGIRLETAAVSAQTVAWGVSAATRAARLLGRTARECLTLTRPSTRKAPRVRPCGFVFASSVTALDVLRFILTLPQCVHLSIWAFGD